MPMQFNYIDLFAGCGGLSLGLYNAGWHGIFAVEKNQDAFSTLKENLIDHKNHYSWPEWLKISNHDIYKLLKNHRSDLISLQGSVPLVVGGPPCQGFSMAGNRNSDDVRNKLFGAYLSFIRLVKPDTLLFENVHGFTVAFSNSKDKKKLAYSDRILRALKREGYKVESKLIDVSEYGVPQKRTRFILIASKTIDPDGFFSRLDEGKEVFLIQKGISQRITVGEAIGDLLKSNGVTACPDYQGFKSGIYGKASSPYQTLMRTDVKESVPNSHRFAKHRKNTEALFERLIADSDEQKKYTPASFDGLKKRSVIVLKENRVCPTITSIPDDLIHYSEPRIPTVRELARIQSFPDWYCFKGRYTTGGERRKVEVPRYTQVANAVPPLFAEQIGIVLKEMITGGRDTSL
jgi:DNA (cytosine-5)-methyltransferase 1